MEWHISEKDEIVGELLCGLQILANPFDDIVPRVTKKKEKSDEPHRKKSKAKATK